MLKHRLTHFAIALGFAFSTAFLMYQQLDWASGRSGLEGETLSILRDLEIDILKMNGAISDNRSFSDDEFRAIMKISQSAIEHCARLQSTIKKIESDESQGLERPANEICALTKERDQAVRSFANDNIDLREALGRCHERTLTAQSCPFFPDLLRITHSLLIENFPSDAQMTVLETQLQEFVERNRKYRHDPIFRGAFNDVTTVIRTSRSRLKLETLIMSSSYLEKFESLRSNSLNNYLEIQKTHSRNALIISIFAILLLVGATYIALRLWKNSSDLRNFNTELEKKIEERTDEVIRQNAELQRQQRILAQNAKMSALGEMAGGIAHEINTPLAAISLHAELIEQQVGDTTEHAQTITSIVDKISKIVVGLKRFSRTGEADRKSSVLFKTILDDTLLLCAERLRSKQIALEMKGVDDVTTLLCIPGQISQVLMNLLNNAVDAVESASEKKIEISVNHDDRRVFIEVADSGPSLSAAVQDKLMQPFFTTKPIGKGTGLGLSISRGIAEMHGGSLTLEKARSHTTFLLTVPKGDSEPSA